MRERDGASRSGRAALSPSIARGTRWNLARGGTGTSTFASIRSANVCSLLRLVAPPPLHGLLLVSYWQPDRKRGGINLWSRVVVRSDLDWLISPVGSGIRLAAAVGGGVVVQESKALTDCLLPACRHCICWISVRVRVCVKRGLYKYDSDLEAPPPRPPQSNPIQTARSSCPCQASRDQSPEPAAR